MDSDKWEKLREENIKLLDDLIEQELNAPDVQEAINTINKRSQKPEKVRRTNSGGFRRRSVKKALPPRKQSARLAGKSFNFKEPKNDDGDESSSSSEYEAPEEYAPLRRRISTVAHSSSINVNANALKVSDVTSEMLDNIAHRCSLKVYSDTGTTCHQCRQKTLDTKTVCRNKGCPGVRGQFCGICLLNRYGEKVSAALLNPEWICPPCRGICNCSICRNRQGKLPTGMLTPKALELGHRSVKDYLVSLSNFTIATVGSKKVARVIKPQTGDLLGYIDGNDVVVFGDEKLNDENECLLGFIDGLAVVVDENADLKELMKIVSSTKNTVMYEYSSLGAMSFGPNSDSDEDVDKFQEAVKGKRKRNNFDKSSNNVKNISKRKRESTDSIDESKNKKKIKLSFNGLMKFKKSKVLTCDEQTSIKKNIHANEIPAEMWVDIKSEIKFEVDDKSSVRTRIIKTNNLGYTNRHVTQELNVADHEAILIAVDTNIIETIESPKVANNSEMSETDKEQKLKIPKLIKHVYNPEGIVKKTATSGLVVVLDHDNVLNETSTDDDPVLNKKNKVVEAKESPVISKAIAGTSTIKNGAQEQNAKLIKLKKHVYTSEGVTEETAAPGLVVVVDHDNSLSETDDDAPLHKMKKSVGAKESPVISNETAGPSTLREIDDDAALHKMKKPVVSNATADSSKITISVIKLKDSECVWEGVTKETATSGMVVTERHNNGVIETETDVDTVLEHASDAVNKTALNMKENADKVNSEVDDAASLSGTTCREKY